MISDRNFFVIKPQINEEGKFICLNPVDLFHNSHSLYLEIGCGKGEFIARYSILHPEYNYIGLEAAEKRINNTLKKLTQFFCIEIQCSVFLVVFYYQLNKFTQ